VRGGKEREERERERERERECMRVRQRKSERESGTPALRVQNQQVHYGTARPICNCVPIYFFIIFFSVILIIVLYNGSCDVTVVGIL